MSWFRRRGAGPGDDAEEAGPDRRRPGSVAEDGAADRASTDQGSAEEASGPAAAGPDAGADPRPDRSAGPYDVSELEDDLERIDLGALRVPAVPGMELRLEVEEATQRVVAATVALAGSTAQMQVFAAPRSEGIWRGVRHEIAESVTGQGGTADEVDGVFGTELLARIPARTPDGRTGHQLARFVGVDGPRWFLRAVLSGPAAGDDEQAEPLLAVLRGSAVVRGPEAMAPRDLLSLRLPPAGPPSPAPDAAATAGGGVGGLAPEPGPLG